MRKTLLPLGLLLTVALASAAEPHTWTDATGKTFVGEMVSANKVEITIRGSNGVISRYPRNLLSAKDLAYADQAGSAIPIEVKLDVSRVKFSVATDNSTQGVTITTEEWGYYITLNSKTMHAASNLRVDYQLYVRQAKLGETMSSQPLKNRAGVKNIPKLDAGGKTNFKTIGVPARLVQLQQGYYWTATGHSEDVNDKLEGIWVRVFQGSTMIAEYASSETFKKGGWPVEKNPAK